MCLYDLGWVRFKPCTPKTKVVWDNERRRSTSRVWGTLHKNYFVPTYKEQCTYSTCRCIYCLGVPRGITENPRAVGARGISVNI